MRLTNENALNSEVHLTSELYSILLFQLLLMKFHVHKALVKKGTGSEKLK